MSQKTWTEMNRDFHNNRRVILSVILFTAIMCSLFIGGIMADTEIYYARKNSDPHNITDIKAWAYIKVVGAWVLLAVCLYLGGAFDLIGKVFSPYAGGVDSRD